MPDVLVKVVHVEQETPHFCGPATAQMVLTALGVPPVAAPPPPTWQESLYDFITKHSGRKKRPKNAPVTVESPAYAHQKCERCPGEDYSCWSTTPDALKKVLNANQKKATYTVNKVSDEAKATDRVLDTIDRGFPGAALVYGWQHWLVVDGYRQNEKGSTMVTGRNLNGVYIRDPKQPPTVDYIPWNVWKDDYLSFVPCGTCQDKIVVISAK